MATATAGTGSRRQSRRTGRRQGQLRLQAFPTPCDSPARGAAEPARCAADQGKFWEYHDRLYTAPSKLEPENPAEHARSAGLDEARFRSCVANGKFRTQIEQDLQDGTKAGVVGTPTFFIKWLSSTFCAKLLQLGDLSG